MRNKKAQIKQAFERLWLWIFFSSRI